MSPEDVDGHLLDLASLDLLEEAAQRLDRGFSHLPSNGAERVDREEMRRVLLATADRLTDNFPYPHPLYAGQMLKPPHPVARLAWRCGSIPTTTRSTGGRASSEVTSPTADAASFFSRGLVGCEKGQSSPSNVSGGVLVGVGLMPAASASEHRLVDAVVPGGVAAGLAAVGGVPGVDVDDCASSFFRFGAQDRSARRTMLVIFREAATAFAARIEADRRWRLAFEPELDIVVWARRAPTARGMGGPHPGDPQPRRRPPVRSLGWTP